MEKKRIIEFTENPNTGKKRNEGFQHFHTSLSIKIQVMNIRLNSKAKSSLLNYFKLKVKRICPKKRGKPELSKYTKNWTFHSEIN